MQIATTPERLKEIMEKQGLRQVDVLKKVKPYCDKYGVKISKSCICRCLNYGIVPRQDKILVLAEALDVSPEYLMGADMENNSDLFSNIAKDRKAMNIVRMYFSLPEPIKNSFYDLIKSVYCEINLS